MRRWLVSAVLAAACTHAGEDGPVVRAPTTRVVGDAGLPGEVSAVAAWAGPCPVAVENAAVEVARVAGVPLTVCDVAVRAWQRTREGLPPRSARALVDELVEEEGAAALVRDEMAGAEWRDRAVAATLAEGLIRADALAGVAVPDDAAMARWYAAHVEDFQRPVRVRARWVVLRTERAARAAIAAVRGGEAFEGLLGESIDPLRARDHGDIGELRLEEVPAAVGSAVVAAAFAIGEDGAVAEVPVRVNVTTTVTVRGRQRARRVAGWAVVQRLGRREAEVLPLEAVRRRVQHRMMRERYETAREETATRWEERVRALVEAAVEVVALGTVRVAAGR